MTFRAIGTVATLLICLGFHQAEASDGAPLQNFVQLCIGEMSRGFNWKHGSWKPVRFEPSRYVIRKLTVPKSRQDARAQNKAMAHFHCSQPEASEKQDSKTYKSYKVCIGIQEAGAKNGDFELCDEVHRKMKNGTGWLVIIYCPGQKLYFEPNGWFHRSSIHADVRRNPPNDYKDSLTISVGKCTNIK